MALTVLSLLAVGVCCVSGQTFDQLPSSASVLEGGSAEFSCTVLSNDPSPTRLNSVWAILMPGPGRTEQLLGINNINMTDLEGSTAFIGTPFNSPLTIANVTRSLNGTRVRCLFLVGIDPSLQPEPYAFLTVLAPPVYTFLPNQPTTVLEGEDFTYSFGFEANPTPTNFTWSRDGQVISSGGRIATSVSTISITSTTRSDSRVYEVVSYSEAGRGAGNFTLDVQYPPEYANTPPVQFTQLMVGAPFTLNCTPSAANPPVDTVSIEVDRSPVTSGDTVTVTDNILTIPSVQRSHSGNYSCNATNTRGSAVIFDNLLVVVLIRCCKSDSSYDDVKVELKGVHSHFEDVKLESNPAYGEVTSSQAQTEPQPYEEFVAIGGVTSDSAAMEDNPAYQAAESQQYERVVGVTSSDVAMEENPAYQSIDTTESQTEEPEYL